MQMTAKRKTSKKLRIREVSQSQTIFITPRFF